MVETGRCFYYDEQPVLWCAISYQDQYGIVITVDVCMENL